MCDGYYILGGKTNYFSTRYKQKPFTFYIQTLQRVYNENNNYKRAIHVIWVLTTFFLIKKIFIKILYIVCDEHKYIQKSNLKIPARYILIREARGYSTSRVKKKRADESRRSAIASVAAQVILTLASLQ